MGSMAASLVSVVQNSLLLTNYIRPKKLENLGNRNSLNKDSD